MINKFFIITLLFSFDYSINAFQTLTRRDLVIYSPLITGYYKKKAFANNINEFFCSLDNFLGEVSITQIVPSAYPLSSINGTPA